MASFRCLCGERINLAPIPNPVGFELIFERIEEEILEEVIQEIEQLDGSLPLSDKFKRELYLKFGHTHSPGIMQVYECQACRRLAVFARASDTSPSFWFQQEKTNYPNVAETMVEMVNKLRAGELPRDWQNSAEIPIEE